ncbi:MAG: glycosyltransferase family 8 protein [Clostridia bacterium]|nr:glycosyltransferase family 8 protein [Clostridia bacterium]
MKNQKQIIPVFFATDDRYVPFLDVALRSLKDHISKNYIYQIVVLNTGLDKRGTDKILTLTDKNFRVEFADVSDAMGELKDKLPNLFHFGLAAYYRLFIEQMFPQYDKILYLDCDVVVKSDVAELYFTDLEGKWIGGVVDQYVKRTAEFCEYTENAVGVNRENYINSGIMLIDLEKFRENNVENTFIELVNKYNFETVDPDQAYINFICKDKIKYLPVCWNRTPVSSLKCDNPKIIHYALYKKPWQYEDTFLGEHFWEYAKKSPFYKKILSIKRSFGEEERKVKESAGIIIKSECLRIAASANTFRRVFAGVGF